MDLSQFKNDLLIPNAVAGSDACQWSEIAASSGN
jgi:hypothetical protein